MLVHSCSDGTLRRSNIRLAGRLRHLYNRTLGKRLVFRVYVVGVSNGKQQDIFDGDTANRCQEMSRTR